MLSYHTPLPGAVQITRPVDQKSPPQFVATYDFFDVKRLRLVERLPDEQLDFIHEHSKRAEMKPGNPIPGYLNKYLIINLPRRPALESLAEIPEAMSYYGDDGEMLDPMCNFEEIAHDSILPGNISAEKFQKLFNKHFVARWHGDHVSAYDRWGTTSYSDRERISIDDRDVDDRDVDDRHKEQRGISYRWYWDKPCKVSTKRWNCFHFEVLHEGQHAVQQIGIRHPRDALTFDFAAHRRKFLESQLFKLDYEILGRSDHNRRHKSRRRMPLITESGRNYDKMHGIRLFSKYGRHPDWIDDEDGIDRCHKVNGAWRVGDHARGGLIQKEPTLQRFVDVYGRGDFLIPITMLDLLRMAASLY